MLLTVKAESPLFVMVKVCCDDEPTVTLPKSKLPLSPIILVGAAKPFPEIAIVFTPLVLLQFTVTVVP